MTILTDGFRDPMPGWMAHTIGGAPPKPPVIFTQAADDGNRHDALCDLMARILKPCLDVNPVNYINVNIQKENPA